MSVDVTSWFRIQVPRRRAVLILSALAFVCVLLFWMVYPWPHDYVRRPEIKFMGYEWDGTQQLLASYRIVNVTGGPISFHEIDTGVVNAAGAIPGIQRFYAGNSGDRIDSMQHNEERVVTIPIPWQPAPGAGEPSVEVRFAYWDGTYALLGLSNLLPDTPKNYLRAKMKSRMIGRPKYVNQQLPKPVPSEVASTR